MSTFEEKLREHFNKNAFIADKKGYGLTGVEVPKIASLGGSTSGGVGRKRRLPKGGCYENEVKAVVDASGDTASFPMPGFKMGMGLSGGCHLCGCQMNGHGLSGGALYRRGVKSQNRVAAGKRAASDNPWIKKVKEYAAENKITYKQAMIALKKK